MNDYDLLRDYLKKQKLPEFVLSFEQIEEIIDAGSEIFQGLACEFFLTAAHVEHDAGADRGEADHGGDR